MWLMAAAFAADEVETVVSASPMGVLGFTLANVADYEAGVEHVRGHHGFVAIVDGIHVHGDPTHTSTLGGRVGYRWHFAPSNAPFVGVLASAGTGFSKYYLDHHHSEFERFDVRYWSVVPHVGYRWTLGERFRVTARFGAGYGDYRVTASEDGHDGQTALVRDRLQFSPVKLDGELSLGVAF